MIETLAFDCFVDTFLMRISRLFNETTTSLSNSEDGWGTFTYGWSMNTNYWFYRNIKECNYYIQNHRAHDIVSWLNNLKNLQGIRVITNYCIWGVNHQDLIMPSIENVKAAVIVADSFKQRCLHLSSNRLEYYINLHDFNYLKAIRVTLLLLF
jgi:hypothetical protein